MCTSHDWGGLCKSERLQQCINAPEDPFGYWSLVYLHIDYMVVFADISKKSNNSLEHQRALAAVGHIYLDKYLDDAAMGNTDISTLTLAHNSFKKSWTICES